ncbi:hypothetical protein OB919_12650 [Halobacteria archaeon AArc-curdl1]|uniref:Uncharacterized protein n=1 Tax=Natronosalvus hydrolyticus TaxID=2979988 RepID=A0AAP3E821_9EURY|nr:hypothetical protein [Halobacteria archaeon AArc-curdl1]
MQAIATLEVTGRLVNELGVPDLTLAQLSPNGMVAIALLVTVALVVIIAILLYFSFAIQQDPVGHETDAEESE